MRAIATWHDCPERMNDGDGIAHATSPFHANDGIGHFVYGQEGTRYAQQSRNNVTHTAVREWYSGRYALIFNTFQCV